MGEVKCHGCGTSTPDTAGPVHAYMDSSPGCWQIYGELLEWKDSLRGAEAMASAQQLVDSYAVQHSANPDPRNRQSVTVHLMSLCAWIDLDISGNRRRTMIGDWTHRDYPLLAPCPDHYPITVRSVIDASEDERPRVIDLMATTTWSAWALHHGAIRALLLRALS